MATATVTRNCMVCGKQNSVEMPKEAFDRWAAGDYIQTAWPEATADEREAVVSGTHPDCWDKMFPDEDD